VKNPIRNETSLVLVVAVIFSAVAIPVLSGFLEPSQPPAVGAVQIGTPREAAGGAVRDDGAPAPSERQRGTREPRPAADDRPQRRRPAPRQAAPEPPAQSQSAPSAPADDAEDDGGESD
jgi:hypothetical protein